MQRRKPEANLIALIAGLVIMSVAAISFAFWEDGQRTASMLVWIYLAFGVGLGWTWGRMRKL